MRKTGVQRLALTSIILLIVIIFAGAVVRVTGSGLGCPDWPTCWGKLIPPTSVDQIDREKLAADIIKFKEKAPRYGRDPDEITVDSLLTKFDATQTWIEYLNRLITLPLTLVTFILMIACLRTGRFRREGVASFALVIISALVGILVVATGLNTAVITLHSALAFALLFVLTYILWADAPANESRHSIPEATRPQVMVLLACVIIEWILGSQIREITDHLQMQYGVDSRPSWIGKIADSWWFVIHRSFSWSILLAALWLGRKVGWRGFVPRLVLTLVFILMIMGVILSQVGIHAVVQVLHVGLAGILISAVFYWWLAAAPAKKPLPELTRA